MVQEAVSGINQLADDVNRTAQTIQKLAGDSEEIGTVIDLVLSQHTPLSVLVVDDESYARERLVALLEPREEVDGIDRVDSGNDAVEALRASTYDLMFLDVQMPERTGLEVIETLGPSNVPPTIFVTAYDQYALKAFE